jgi:hypothetical protein
MIERQIDSPMPMPLDLVVKKALNSRSAFSAEIPTPQSSPGRLTIDRDGRERHVTHDLAVLHGDK